MADIEKLIKSKSPQGRVYHIVKDTVIYGILMAVSKFSILLILPILTYSLSEEEYGMMDTFTMLAVTFVALGSLAQDTAIGRFFYDEDSKEERKQLVSTGLLIAAILSVLLCALGFIFAEQIIIHTIGSSQYLPVLKLVLIYVPFAVVIQILRFITRWTHNKAGFLVLNIAPALLLLTLTFIFVSICQLGLSGAFIAQIITSAVFVIIGLYICRQLISLKIYKKYFATLIKYGSPLMICYALGCNLYVLDRVYYIKIFGESSLGSYAFGVRYASFSSLLIFALTYAWGPIVYSSYSRINGSETIQKTLNTMAALLSACLFLHIATAEIGIALLAPAGYEKSLVYVLPIALGLYMLATVSVAGIGIDLSKKTWLHIPVAVASYPVYIASISVLTKIYGPLGIALSLMLTFIFITLTEAFIGKRVYPLTLNIFRPYSMIVLSFLLCLVFHALPLAGILSQVALRMSLFIVLCFVLWFTLFDIDDRLKIRNKLKTFLKRNA